MTMTQNQFYEWCAEHHRQCAKSKQEVRNVVLRENDEARVAYRLPVSCFRTLVRDAQKLRITLVIMPN